MADAAKVPVINGEESAGQYPTQALLDLYTLQKEKGFLKNLKVLMIGDLKYDRIVYSLSYAMVPFHPMEYIYMPPDVLQMPYDIVDDMKKKSLTCNMTSDIKDQWIKNSL